MNPPECCEESEGKAVAEEGRKKLLLLLMNALLETAPRFLFFTGKGGVGKTSMACATAVALAGAGRRVLLISTDPASNLDEVLETPLGQSPKAVTGVAGLDAMNIDPEEAALAYRERIVGPYRGILPDAAVTSIEEQLSGACTVEIASFNEFTRIIGHEEADRRLRQRHSGYGADRAHLAIVESAGGLERFHREQQNREFLPGTAGRIERSAAHLRKGGGHPERPGFDDACAGDPGGGDRLEGSGAGKRGTGRAWAFGNQHLIVNGVFTATDPE